MENQDSFISNPALVEEPEKAPVENPDVQTSDMVATTDEITVVDSPIHHHSILSDHQLEVDGVIYRELKTLNCVVNQVLLQTTNNSFSFLILAFRFLFYLFFSNFRMDQMLERMIKYLSTPDPLAIRITLSKKSTLKEVLRR